MVWLDEDGAIVDNPNDIPRVPFKQIYCYEDGADWEFYPPDPKKEMWPTCPSKFVLILIASMLIFFSL